MDMEFVESCKLTTAIHSCADDFKVVLERFLDLLQHSDYSTAEEVAKDAIVTYPAKWETNAVAKPLVVTEDFWNSYLLTKIEEAAESFGYIVTTNKAKDDSSSVVIHTSLFAMSRPDLMLMSHKGECGCVVMGSDDPSEEISIELTGAINH